MRRAARVDNNHGEIRDALRALGFSVFDSSGVGRGFPDLVVANIYQTVLVEVKSGNGTLNDIQQEFHLDWKGDILVAYSLSDVLEHFEYA